MGRKSTDKLAGERKPGATVWRRLPSVTLSGSCHRDERPACRTPDVPQGKSSSAQRVASSLLRITQHRVPRLSKPAWGTQGPRCAISDLRTKLSCSRDACELEAVASLELPRVSAWETARLTAEEDPPAPTATPASRLALILCPAAQRGRCAIPSTDRAAPSLCLSCRFFT